MKRFSKLLLAGAAGAVLSIAAAGSSMAAEVNLKMHHLLGPKSPAHTKMLVPWTERVMKDSGGRIAIEVFPSMSLGGKPPQLVNQVNDGVVDFVWTVLGYTPGRFPRSEVFELPFVHTNNPIATNMAMYDLFQNGMISEDFKDVKIIALHVHAGQAIHTVDKPIHKVEDLKGLKMRIPTRTGGWIIEALGANPVAMPVPDLPPSLSKKVVDGAFIPWEIIPPLKIHELTKYQIDGENNTRFGTTTFMIAMNKDSYNKLPDDLKAVIDKNSGPEWWKEVGQIWTDSEKPGIKMAVDSGNEHIVIPEAELENFRKALEPVVNRWVEEVTAKGIDGQALVNAAREAVAKHSKEGM
jgi:TRAP-type C4-dicarboxylate transport system substrate-binding protein